MHLVCLQEFLPLPEGSNRLHTGKITIHTCNYVIVVVVVVRLEHSHSFIDSFDNHSTASVPASCRRRRPPGNAVSGHSSTMCLVVWWLSPQGQAGDAITPHQ